MLLFLCEWSLLKKSTDVFEWCLSSFPNWQRAQKEHTLIFPECTLKSMLFHTKVCATTLRLKVYSPEHTHSVILWAHSWNKTFFYVSCHMWHTLCSIKHIKHMLKWAYLVWHTFNILIKVHLNLTIDVLKRVYFECTLKDVINKNYYFLKFFFTIILHN